MRSSFTIFGSFLKLSAQSSQIYASLMNVRSLLNEILDRIESFVLSENTDNITPVLLR